MVVVFKVSKFFRFFVVAHISSLMEVEKQPYVLLEMGKSIYPETKALYI
jgi:hypothetical protein